MTRVTPPALNGDKLCAKETNCVRDDCRRQQQMVRNWARISVSAMISSARSAN